MKRPALSLSLLAVYVGLVVAANIMTSRLGLLPAGFGLMVTAGTFAAGLTLAVRNPLQEAAGKRWVVVAIVIGAALSFWLGAGRIAIASGVTFAVAETVDMTVYTWLRRHGWKRAVLAGIIVGAVADTLLFLSLAGFPLTPHTVGGQLLVKAVYAAALGLPMVRAVLSRDLSRERLVTEGA